MSASGTATFTVTDRRALRTAITPMTRAAAGELLAAAQANTPVDRGTLRAGWHIVPGRAPGAFLIENSVRHGQFVEFGTRNIRAEHPLGRAAASIRGRYGTR